jgi:integrase
MEIDVFTRADSPYWFALLIENGKRKKVSLKLLAKGPDAVKRREALKQAEARQDSLAKAPHTQTLQQALDALCDRMAAEGRAYVRNTRTHRDKLLGLRPIVRSGKDAKPAEFHLEPTMLVSQLTTQHMMQLVDARRQEGCSAQTIKHEIATLRSAVRHATARGGDIPRIAFERAVTNPWAVPKVGQKTRYLEFGEWLRVYEALDPDRDIVRVRKATGKAYPAVNMTGERRRQAQDAQDLLVALTMTGGRWSEVASLRWSKIDLSEGVARLWGSKVSEERLVPLPAQFLAVLKRRRTEAAPDAQFVFTGLHGDKRSAPSHAVRQAMDRAGLNSDPDTIKAHGKATIHSLRHTFASWLLQNGADLSAVQDMLGHKTIAMTRRYAHLEKARTAKRMGAILSNLGASDAAG